MRRAHGVEAVLFEDAHAPRFTLFVFARAEHAVVVVDAPAAQLHGPAVHGQTVLGVPFQFPDAEAHALFIQGVSCDTGIEMRRIGAPELCVRDRQIPGLTGGDEVFAVVNLYIVRVRFHLDHRGIDRYGFDFQRSDIRILADQQRDRAADPRAGVPAAVGLQGIIRPHREYVFAGNNEGGDVYVTSSIAVTVAARRVPVYRDIAVLIDAFEMQHE